MADDVAGLWRAVLSGEPDRLERRLALDGATRGDVARIASPGEPPERPAWVGVLEDVAAAAVEGTPRGTVPGRVAGSADGLTAATLGPAVDVGRSRLLQVLHGRLRRLEMSAEADLERLLAQRLAGVLGPVVEHSANGTADSSRFDRLRQILLAYPVASRLAATVVTGWVDSMARLVLRLERDLDLLRATFNGGVVLGPLTAVERAGAMRRVQADEPLVLSFASGLRIVYKPRPVALDAAYADLVAWLNERGLTPPLHTPLAIDAGRYGWQEYVSARSCADPDELDALLERFGMLLAIAHVTGATDLHAENVVVVGERLYVVDAETLLRADPSPDPHGDMAASPSTATARRNSVLPVGILPGTAVTPTGRDVSALSAHAGWNQWASALPGGHRRRLAETRGGVVRAGFTNAYRLLADVRSDLLDADGPLDRAVHAPVRFVLRSSHVYRRVLTRALRPEVLRSGLLFGLELDLLSRPFLSGHIDRRWWPLYEREIAALERLDTPRFAVRADDRAVVADDQPTGAELALSPLELLRARTERLGEVDLIVQQDHIERAFKAAEVIW